MGRCIALVVPAIFEGGGVPAVARFVNDSILRSGEFDVKVISLATSVHDECSTTLIMPRSWRQGIKVREGVWEGLPYVHVGAFASEFEFQRYRPRGALTELLSDCDLIQVVSGAPSWALPVIGLGKPVVLQVATRTIVERRRKEQIAHGPVAWWRRGMTRVIDRFDDRALRAVDAVLVENPRMLEHVSDICANHGAWVRYAPPGVDTQMFCPAQRCLSDASDRGYILSVGRFDDPRKNAEMLLEAFVRMRQAMAHPPRLILAGAGDPGPAFWQRVQESDLADLVSFHLWPTREELVAYYQNARCFALSSDEEGFGVVIIEAMACAVPVVATQCGGPDGIITEGVDGYLVPMGDADAMADRLLRLAKDAAVNAKMGRAARRTIEAHFAQEVAGEIFLDTYRNLLARKLKARSH